MDKSGDWVDTYLPVVGKTVIAKMPQSAVLSVDDYNPQSDRLAAMSGSVLAIRAPRIKRIGRWTVELRA